MSVEPETPFDADPSPDAPTEPPGSVAGPGAPDVPRSRRAVLAGAIGGLAGLIGSRLVSPDRAAAAAGSPLIIGSQANNAGSADTQLLANSAVISLKVYQQGPGTALMGYVTKTSGDGRGVYGRTDSPNGDGVQARNAGAAGTGSAMRAFGGNNPALIATSTAVSVIEVLNSSNAEPAIAARSNAAPAIRGLTGGATDEPIRTALGGGQAAAEFVGAGGVAAATTSAGFPAIHGIGGASKYGVIGTSTDRFGVWGKSTSWPGVAGESTSGSGVQGVSASGTGIYGISTSQWGVWGRGLSGEPAILGSGTSGAGVYAYSEGATALYVEGGAIVSGNLSKGGGSFRIDHPLDPANKYLLHSFVESPDMMNVYNGNVTLDGAGEATVDLPEWWDALNRDPRYQLTPVGAAMPGLHIRSGVKNRAFRIAGGVAGNDVSWQVTGIRKDAWAEAHRIPVEEEKTGQARGRYLHPKEHGKPASTGIEAARLARIAKHKPAKGQASGLGAGSSG